MPALIDLKEELKEITTLKYISAAFTEASAVKIKNIRSSFEKNRKFYDEISQIYHIVKVSAGVFEKKKKKKVVEKITKILSIAITSKQRFYGMLNINTMKKFVEGTEGKKTDRLVIGKTGVDYLNSIQYTHPYESTIFDRDTPNNDETRVVLEKAKPYTSVFVYYPKFETILSQVVGVTDITQAAQQSEIQKEEMIRYIFEPELSKIVEFFETQVRTILFARTVLESELSRTAARLVAMHMAEERADEMIKEKKNQIYRTRKSIMNSQLLDTFAGMKKWKQKWNL